MILRNNTHPTLLTLKEVYESRQYVNLTYKNVAGDFLIPTIRSWLAYSELDAKRIMKSLLEAVKNLHINGLIHRDIKPQGIYLLYDIT